eukprot:TRINITY_DN4818_c0_g1_i1.p2 TRINITY_DN4818_c0_g1~~TRINITY_DN4818_c0_g1_i1.p2  ORF type:complete len:263 (-),score=26.01 TRINITY_DN4818_c0_g1_i1:1195-1983(-)
MANGKKSLKGSVAIVAMNFLRFLNVVIILGGITTIILDFMVQSPLTFPAGWGFFFLSVFIIICGLFGTISSGQVGCFGCHIFCLFVSCAGLIASILLIFMRFTDVVEEMKPNANAYEIYDAEQYIRIMGAIFFFLFMTQMVILMLGCTVHHFGLIEHNEDLDALKQAKELARMQDEYRYDEESQTGGHAQATRAMSGAARGERGERGGGGVGHVGHKLTDKMKKKYRQWTRRDEQEEEMEFDMEGADSHHGSDSPVHSYRET